jgi:acetylornithine deacetylase
MTSPALTATLNWLERLVAYPTIARRSNLELIDEVGDFLQQLGATVVCERADRDDAQNLYAVLGPLDGPRGVMLSAHTDVVDVEGQPWTRDPFKLHVDDGRAYGRGSTDMKGFIASALAALEGVDAERLKRPLWIALSSDEEIGCVGVRPLLESLQALDHRPGWALVGEPTELRVVHSHKGKAAVRVEFHGKAAHSSLPHNGANAVAYAGRLINEVLGLQEQIANSSGRDENFQVPYTTLGIGPVHGGVAVNIVPDYCRLDLEVRTIPSDDPEARAQQLRKLCVGLEQRLREEYAQGSITVTALSGYPGLKPSPDADIDAEITSVCGTAERLAADFGTEAGLNHQQLRIPAVVCGPGSMDDAHGADESVELDQLQRSHRLVRGLLAKLS